MAKKKSFYRVEAPKFDQLFVKIPERELSSFILSTQSWLNTFEGFQVHIVKIQEEMSYRITDEGALQIFKISRKEKVATKEIDCGNWIYIKGDGFYPKAIEQKKSLITNAPIPHHLVVDFIRENEDRLLFVPGFFTSDSPIQEIGLSIQLRK
ncbi:MAG TPA: hypothetical protein VN457_03840, partial [Chlamydiales bacterium]|nr:hypothetical protein [Chlamydiales bacterium]